jgi:hypothetical protein
VHPGPVFELEPACVEVRREETRAELVERGVAGEDVLDDADLGGVVEGQADVLVCDEVDRDPDSSPQPQAKWTRNTAGWAAPGIRSTSRRRTA